jgi:hypothetical protein
MYLKSKHFVCIVTNLQLALCVICKPNKLPLSPTTGRPPQLRMDGSITVTTWVKQPLLNLKNKGITAWLRSHQI